MKAASLALALLLATPPATAQCAPTPHLCGNTCDVRTIIHGAGECHYDSPACAGTCAVPPNYTFSRLSTDYKPAFCVAAAPPAPHPGLHASLSMDLTPRVRGHARVRIPPGHTVHRIYCVGTQDPGYDPVTGPCLINPGYGDACAIGWSWASWGKGNKLPDGSHVFCVEFFNQSGDRTRYYKILAD
jgi:hypothetical protein